MAALVAAGDTSAFAQLVRRHERRVRAFLFRLCRGGGEGDDLAQETFLQAWRMAGTFRGAGSYEGWLLRIAWRQFLSRVRSLKAEVELNAMAEESVDTDPAAGLDLQRALASLTADERAAALLCLGEGYSHSEAAFVLDMPLGTLKSIVARARMKLTKHLGEAGD